MPQQGHLYKGGPTQLPVLRAVHDDGSHAISRRREAEAVLEAFTMTPTAATGGAAELKRPRRDT